MLQIDCRNRFNQTKESLAPHATHRLVLSVSNSGPECDGITLICEYCSEVLVAFVPVPVVERPDPDTVRYEGHFDSARDVCYVQVFKPGKAPYPMQERQDIRNHSPNGISWGYGGSGAAQCALAILLDYLGDEGRSRKLYQHFKFRVIAKFTSNSDWTLTGRQIENALASIGEPPGQQESSDATLETSSIGFDVLIDIVDEYWKAGCKCVQESIELCALCRKTEPILRELGRLD